MDFVGLSSFVRSMSLFLVVWTWQKWGLVPANPIQFLQLHLQPYIEFTGFSTHHASGLHLDLIAVTVTMTVMTTRFLIIRTKKMAAMIRAQIRVKQSLINWKVGVSERLKLNNLMKCPPYLLMLVSRNGTKRISLVFPPEQVAAPPEIHRLNPWTLLVDSSLALI